jgi:uncharacterized membrane-anchored protein YhcB (DUF1043 family)
LIEVPVLLLQIDGIGMNATTFGIVTTVVMGLIGVITFLFKMATSNQDKYIDRLQRDKDRLEGEKQELMDALVDVMRTAHRGADAADDAARELMKQRRRKP